MWLIYSSLSKSKKSIWNFLVLKLNFNFEKLKININTKKFEIDFLDFENDEYINNIYISKNLID